jgi:uncharacterized iron-regulated protein
LLAVSIVAATACEPAKKLAVSPTAPVKPSEPEVEKMPTIEWQSPLLRDHPLVGQIFDVRRGSVSTEQELITAARASHYVLLGEQHDNADHHVRQAALVRATVGHGRTPAVAFEMFDVSDQPAIDTYFKGNPNDAFGLGAAVGWEQKGWPLWPMYAEIVQAGVRGKARIVGANLPRSEVMGAAKSGSVLVDGEPRPLPELPPDQAEAMKEEMFNAHCQHLPKEMMGMMAAAQIARDVTLAHRVISADQGDGTILIAGNGHARTDRGVPWHLSNQGVKGSVLSVGFLEVREGELDPKRYGDDGAPPPHDFVWFTPGWDRGDPCEEFRR